MSSADPFSSRFEVFGREPNHIVAKINRPAFERLKRLLDLDEGGDGRVILLRAPRAGFGKTSLLQRLAGDFAETHHFVRVNLAAGRTTDAAHVLEYVLQALCKVLPDSTTLTDLDLLARKILALGLEPLVASGEVPCQDREGALLALQDQPIETFDFHHDRAVTAHWTKSNFEILGPRLAAELARLSGASLREASYWVELLFRFATTAPDNVERARLLFETVFRGEPPNQSESASEERLHGLLSLLGTVTRLVLIVDDTEGLSTNPPDALELASFLTNISQSCPGTVVLLSVNSDVWETAFLPLLPHGLADRLSEYLVALEPLTDEQARELVKSRGGHRAHEVLAKIEWGSEDLYARHVLKCASEAWEALGVSSSLEETGDAAESDENQTADETADVLDDLEDLDDFDDDPNERDLIDEPSGPSKSAPGAAVIKSAAGPAAAPASSGGGAAMFSVGEGTVGALADPVSLKTSRDEESDPFAAESRTEDTKIEEPPLDPEESQLLEAAESEVEEAPVAETIEPKPGAASEPIANPFAAKAHQTAAAETSESADAPADDESDAEESASRVAAEGGHSFGEQHANPFAPVGGVEKPNPFAPVAGDSPREKSESPYAETLEEPEVFGNSASFAAGTTGVDNKTPAAGSPLAAKKEETPDQEREYPFAARTEPDSSDEEATPFAAKTEVSPVEESASASPFAAKAETAPSEETSDPFAARDNEPPAEKETNAFAAKHDEASGDDLASPLAAKLAQSEVSSPEKTAPPFSAAAGKAESEDTNPFAAKPENEPAQGHPFQAKPGEPDSEPESSSDAEESGAGEESLAPAAESDSSIGESAAATSETAPESGVFGATPPPLAEPSAPFAASPPPFSAPGSGPPPIVPPSFQDPTSPSPLASEPATPAGESAFVPVGEKPTGSGSGEDSSTEPPASPFAALGGKSAEKNLSDVSSIFAPIQPRAANALDTENLKPLLDEADNTNPSGPPPVPTGGSSIFQPHQPESSGSPFRAAPDQPDEVAAFKPLSNDLGAGSSDPATTGDNSGFRPIGQPPSTGASPESLSGSASSDLPSSPLKPVSEAPAFGSEATAFGGGAEVPFSTPAPASEESASSSEPAPASPFQAKGSSPFAASPPGEAPANEALDRPAESPFKPVKLQPVKSDDSPFSQRGPEPLSATDLPQRTELPPKKIDLPSPPASTSSPFEAGTPPTLESAPESPHSSTPFEAAAPTSSSPFSSLGPPPTDSPDPESTPGAESDSDKDKVDELLRQFKERYGRK